MAKILLFPVVAPVTVTVLVIGWIYVCIDELVGDIIEFFDSVRGA